MKHAFILVMKARILIPRCRGRVAPLFDVAAEVTVFSADDGTIKEETEVSVKNVSPAGWHSWCEENGVTHLICSAISRGYSDYLNDRGIDIIPGIRGNVGDVIEAWINRRLTVQSYQMPGCSWRRNFTSGQCPRYSEILKMYKNTREVNPMKIAISAEENSLDGQVDARFGRAKGFIIYDIDTGEFVYKANDQNLNAPQGAGIQSAKNVIDAGAGSILSGHLGPKAFATLQAAGVKVYTNVSGSITEAIEKYKAGGLTPSAGADVEGHW